MHSDYTHVLLRRLLARTTASKANIFFNAILGKASELFNCATSIEVLWISGVFFYNEACFHRPYSANTSFTKPTKICLR